MDRFSSQNHGFFVTSGYKALYRNCRSLPKIMILVKNADVDWDTMLENNKTRIGILSLGKNSVQKLAGLPLTTRDH